jgi:nicotinate-nucleotide adenylyltransferase
MNIGLLGGMFNPPHLGHLLIAQQVLDFTDCEAIWFVPSYKHTFQKEAVSPEHRLAMINAMVEESHEKRFSVCTLELDNKLDGNTINLLPLLPKEHIYHFIIGSDQLPSFHLWGDWKNLLKQIPFLVFPRYGYPNEPLYEHMTMVNDGSLIVSNISSTKVRDRVIRNLPLYGLVSTSVDAYIQKQYLFQS